MLTFLFWNLKGNRPDLAANLVRHHGVDILMLAECPTVPANMLEALNRPSAEVSYLYEDHPKLAIYSRFADRWLRPIGKGNDYTIKEIALLERPALLLCVVHFPSKLYRTAEDQWSYTTTFCNSVLASAEKDAGHNRTIIVGDLNMNPYETALVAANAFHAVPTRAIASRERRTVKFESNRYFYNPIGRHFGARPQAHSGT